MNKNNQLKSKEDIYNNDDEIDSHFGIFFQ